MVLSSPDAPILRGFRSMPPKDHPLRCWNCDELEAVFSSLLSEFLLRALVVLHLLLAEDAFVIGLPGGEQVIEDACQLVRGGRDGLGRAEFGAHTPVVLAQPGLASVQRLRR